MNVTILFKAYEIDTTTISVNNLSYTRMYMTIVFTAVTVLSSARMPKIGDN